MFDVIAQIIIPLVVAGALGLFSGWLLWSWRSQRISQDQWTAMAEKVDSAEEAQAVAATEAETFAQQREVFTTEKADLESRIEVLASALDGSTTRMADLSGELADANAQIAELETRDVDIEDQLAALHTEIDLGKQRINALRGEVVDRNKQIAELQTELKDYADVRTMRLDFNDAKATIVSLRADREEARVMAADLKAKLNEREARIMELMSSPQYVTDLFSPTPTAEVPVIDVAEHEDA